MIQNQLPTRVYKTGKVVVNWAKVEKGFTVEHEGAIYKVVSNKNVEKVSKNGNTYKTRRLVITDVNELVELEIGTDSFKKGSFIKRFNKLLQNAKPKEVKNLGAENDDFDYSQHMYTESERVEQQNELYRILTERGLLQAYTDWERGKIVDKSTMEQIMKAMDDSIPDLLDLDELEESA